MRRSLLLAGVAVLALVAPARADIDPGDLDSFFGDLVEFFEEVLLETVEPGAELIIGRLQGLVGVAQEVPAGDPVILYPTTVDEADEFTAELQADRKERADATDELTSAYLDGADEVSASLAELQAQNLADPVSVAGQLQIGNAATLIQTNELSLTTAAIMAQTRLATDQARQEVEDRARAIASLKARNENGMWQGNRTFAKDNFELMPVR